MSSSRPVVFLLAVMLAGACSAQTIICPEQITAPGVLERKYEEWRSFSSSLPHYFDYIALTAGSPDQGATLVPDFDTKAEVMWNLPAGEEHWVVCNYLSSDVRLARQLPADVRVCSVRRKPVGTKATQQLNELRCK